MLTHEEMIGLQAEKHQLIDARNFRSGEEYVLHLIHAFAYVQASTFAEGKTVLDLGCNTGYGTSLLSKIAKKVVGVDVSKEAISAAKKDYGSLGIDFRVIDGKQMPFDDDEFDVIMCCQVIEHIVDYDIFLEELKRVLSPTGVAVFTTPNSLIRLDPGMKPWNKFHVHEFDHSELQKLLMAHFSAVQIMGLFAEESTYLVEKNRLSREREAARKRQQHSHYYRLLSTMESVAPDKVLRQLKKLKKSLAASPWLNRRIDRTFTEQHDLGDFFYRTDRLDAALDLLGLCTNDDNMLDGVERRLKMA